MESIYSSLLELTRVDGTIRPYRYFSNHDDKVALGPREHSLKLQFRVSDGPGTGPTKSEHSLLRVIDDKVKHHM